MCGSDGLDNALLHILPINVSDYGLIRAFESSVKNLGEFMKMINCY